MQTNLKVFKFGESMLTGADGLKEVFSILQKNKNEPLVIIVSTLGGSIGKLEKIAETYAKQTGEAMQQFEEFKNWHYQLMLQLFDETDPVFEEVNEIFVAGEWTLEEEPHPDYSFIYGQIVSIGALASSKIITAYLNQSGLPTNWLDARDIIITDNTYREGGVLWEETLENAKTKAAPLMDKGGFVLTQGGIGCTTENFTTTLGKGGVDYSAAIFSFCLESKSLTVWKGETKEVSPKAVELLQKKGIPCIEG